MTNPYAPSEAGLKSIHSRPWWIRFALALVFMSMLNLLPLWFTWSGYGADGYERVGFPFTFLERGGFSYRLHVHYGWLAADVGMAVVLAYAGAESLRDGWCAACRRLRTWGLDD